MYIYYDLVFSVSILSNYESEVMLVIPCGSSPVVRVISSNISLPKSVSQVCVNAGNFCLCEIAQVSVSSCWCGVYGCDGSLGCCWEFHGVGRICLEASGGL